MQTVTVLNVAEKPSVAKEIAHILGRGGVRKVGDLSKRRGFPRLASQALARCVGARLHKRQGPAGSLR